MIEISKIKLIKIKYEEIYIYQKWGIPLYTSIYI